jgi:hypothetical protein
MRQREDHCELDASTAMPAVNPIILLPPSLRLLVLTQ